MRKVVSLLLVLALFLSLTLVGCGSSNTDTKPSVTDEGTVNEKQGSNTANNEPGKPDLSKKITIELMQQGWTNMPRDEKDPYQKWMNETFNVEFKLTSTSEFANEILVRFASDDPPDMIGLNKNQLETLYDQSVVVKDWNKYLDRIPSMNANIDDSARKLFTRDGKLIGLPGKKEPHIWGLKIRADWLESLGLSAPQTDTELLEVARKFTFGDPDKNGKDDTYAFTSAGGNQSLGEIDNLQGMYGPTNFYITQDGKVSHPILDGNRLKFLNFMRTVVKEKLIDPDWYTQGWNDRKPKLFQGAFGFCWYPGVLVHEIEGGTGNTGKTINWYDAIGIPKGSEMGGKRAPGNFYSTLNTVSAKAEQDKEKFERILYIMEQTAFPNDGFWKRRWGVEIDNFEVKELDDGYKYIDVLGEPGQHYRGGHGNMGAWDWGTAIGTRADLVIEGTTKEVNDATLKNIEFDKATKDMPAFSDEGLMLNLDAQVLEETSRVQREFEIKYIMEKENNYDKFVQSWLSAGGQKLLDSATEQFKALGLIK